MGICGVEFHAHTWELGPRKAKELLFTGDAITAQQAEQLGMVNKVVPLDELVPTTLALAQRIAKQDAFSLRMAKRAVNRTLDIQGFTSSIDAIFDAHHLGHARAALTNDMRIPALIGLNAMRDKNKAKE
jgi:enoyl-CoA hydratase